MASSSSSLQISHTATSNTPSLNQKSSLKTSSPELSTFIEFINSNDLEKQLKGVVGIRKLLSVEHNAPIKTVIKSGIVPQLLKFMSPDYDSVFQFESAWAVTNICSGPSKGVEHVVASGGIDNLVYLLDSGHEDVLEQAIWALSNIAGDKSKYRDICLKKECVDKLITALQNFSDNKNIKRNATWAMLNLIRTKPIPQWEHVSKGVLLIQKYLEETEDEESLINVLQTLAKISENNIQEVLDLGCLPTLISHMKSDNLSILSPALATLGNLVTGDDQQTSTVLKQPTFLPRIFELTGHPNKKTRKEACWVISNITAGSKDQIAEVLDNPYYMNKLMEILNEDVIEVAMEVGWAFSNMASGASSQQIMRLVNEYNYLGILDTMFSKGKSKMNNIALEAALWVLKSGEKIAESSPYTQKFIDQGLVEKIRKLATKQKYTDQAEEILTFFDGEDSDYQSSAAGVEESDDGDEEEEEQTNSDEDEEDNGNGEGENGREDSDDEGEKKVTKGKKGTKSSQRFRRED